MTRCKRGRIEAGANADLAVVEIGSGNGYFALPAARVVDPGTVYALDIDGDLLAELETLALLQGLDNIVTIEGDARALADHLPEPADVCVLANTMHGIDEVGRVLEEVAHTLAADGQFIVINWDARPDTETTVAGEPRGPPNELRLSPAETQRIIEDAGFELVRQVDLLPYHYGLIFEEV